MQPDKVKVTDDKCFVGWDAYQKVLATDVNLVILTQAPDFRACAPEGGDRGGQARVHGKTRGRGPRGRALGDRVVGLGRQEEPEDSGRHADAPDLAPGGSGQEDSRRRHRGDPGGQRVRLGDGMLTWGPQQREPGWSDMEWQLRRWLFMTWLSGDFITEMHIHNLDVMNWLIGAHPVECIGMGGRGARTAPEYGDSFDHFAVEYEYPKRAAAAIE